MASHSCLRYLFYRRDRRLLLPLLLELPLLLLEDPLLEPDDDDELEEDGRTLEPLELFLVDVDDRFLVELLFERFTVPLEDVDEGDALRSRREDEEALDGDVLLFRLEVAENPAEELDEGSEGFDNLLSRVDDRLEEI